jgi:hypothetical protein
MDSFDFDRNKVIPIIAGEHVLVTQEVGKDRQGQEKPPHPGRPRPAKGSEASAGGSRDEQGASASPEQGQIIDIRI